MQLQLYGIRNCDSCRGALRWLAARSVPHAFHDLREEPPSRELLRSWLDSPHASRLLNRRSTTWRQLPDAQRGRADRDPLPLLCAHPTLIKRPVITDGSIVLDVGFDPVRLEEFA
jgi:arsenate reductase